MCESSFLFILGFDRRATRYLVINLLTLSHSIESMKMETVIRSPQSGVVKKLAHKEGDICKAGTVLVIFEEGESAQGSEA